MRPAGGEARRTRARAAAAAGIDVRRVKVSAFAIGPFLAGLAVRPALARALGHVGALVPLGVAVLVGDPGRADLPLDRLTPLARYEVPEVGAQRDAATTPATVYAFG